MARPVLVGQIMIGLIALIGPSFASWTQHNEPSESAIPENGPSIRFQPHSSYLWVDASEGDRFELEDHPEQSYGIKDQKFSYETLHQGSKTNLFVTAGQNLDREQQGLYQFKVKLYKNNILVPGPVWYAKFLITDVNDNPPDLENSKEEFHFMEENHEVGTPLKPGNGKPSNGIITITDPDTTGNSFIIKTQKTMLVSRHTSQEQQSPIDLFEFGDFSGDETKKRIIYENKFPNIADYKAVLIHVKISDCAKGCDGSVQESDTKIIKISIQDANDQSPELIMVSYPYHC